MAVRGKESPIIGGADPLVTRLGANRLEVAAEDLLPSPPRKPTSKLGADLGDGRK